jgi:hypothetical protein
MKRRRARAREGVIANEPNFTNEDDGGVFALLSSVVAVDLLSVFKIISSKTSVTVDLVVFFF